MEQLKAFLLVLLVVAVTFVFYSSGLQIATHEVGHALMCEIQQGDSEYWVSLTDGKCRCTAPEWNRLQKFMFYSGGIGLELLIATFLLLIPSVSVAGGTMYLFLGGSLLFGNYERDISLLVSDVSPKFSFLLDDNLQLMIFALMLGIFLFSFHHTYSSLRKE